MVPAARAEILVRDIGVIGLFSHDVFAWDHRAGKNTENGRLDLSTIFDYNQGKSWRTGGNPKNSDNPPVYSIMRVLKRRYTAAVISGETTHRARQMTVALFHRMLEETYMRVRGRALPPVASSASVNDVDQAAFRALHDVLPGRIPLKRWFPLYIKVTGIDAREFELSEEELDQEIPGFDGEYASEYRRILDLMRIDRRFIESHSDFKQADMLDELKRYGSGEITADQISFIPYIDGLFAKALCATGNEWMPQDRPCAP